MRVCVFVRARLLILFFGCCWWWWWCVGGGGGGGGAGRAACVCVCERECVCQQWNQFIPRRSGSTRLDCRQVSATLSGSVRRTGTVVASSPFVPLANRAHHITKFRSGQLKQSAIKNERNMDTFASSCIVLNNYLISSNLVLPSCFCTHVYCHWALLSGGNSVLSISFFFMNRGVILPYQSPGRKKDTTT